MKIPPEAHDEIMRLAAKGKPSREIAKWLASSKHRAKVSHAAIAKLVKKERVERSEVAKAVLAEHVAERLPGDIEELDGIYERVVALLKNELTLAEGKKSRGLKVFDVDKIVKLWGSVQRADANRQKALGLDQPDPLVDGLADFLSKGF